MLLFAYTTTRKGFVIFTRAYLKLSWNTTALSQSNWRNFSCSSIREEIHNTANTEQRQGSKNLKKIKKRIAIVVFKNLLT